MGKKLIILILSIITAVSLISGGYGKWSEELNIVGDIQVVPNPEVLSDMESQLSRLEKQLEEEIEKQRLYEEQQKALAEQQAVLDAQKLLEEQKLKEQEGNLTVDPNEVPQSDNETNNDINDIPSENIDVDENEVIDEFETLPSEYNNE